MNIPQDTLQQVADAAFGNSQLAWGHASPARRAVIQHAITNPALAPFLSALPRRKSPALAEATPPAEVAIIEEQAWVDPVCGCIRSPDAPKDSPCPICNPAAQVPQVDLEQDDFKPGTWIEYPCGARGEVEYVRKDRVKVRGLAEQDTFTDLRLNGCRMNTSIPDTGRWDATAWRPCSKPGKEVAK